jgi:osmotically-inducible protein OsmY
MKYAVAILSTVALSACDGLSVAQKKPAAQVVRITPQPIQQENAAPDARAQANDFLAARVKQALEREEKALAANVDVVADSGAVTLWGTASADHESVRVGKVALKVEGVKSVDNKIVVIKGS